MLRAPTGARPRAAGAATVALVKDERASIATAAALGGRVNIELVSSGNLGERLPGRDPTLRGNILPKTAYPLLESSQLLTLLIPPRILKSFT